MIDIAQIIKAVPGVRPYLSGRARYIDAVKNKAPQEYKTFEFFLETLRRLIHSLYVGNIGGDFIDVMANLIQGQINQAVMQSWMDEGLDGIMPGYLSEYASEVTLRQYDFVDQFYRDIVDARINETPEAPLMARAEMWANRYNEAYNGAKELIAAENGGRMKWVYGEAEHCDTCLQLNGIVAFASEWRAAGFRPQNAPNNMLDCGGWNCKCRLETTDDRRSPKALDTLINIAMSR